MENNDSKIDEKSGNKEPCSIASRPPAMRLFFACVFALVSVGLTLSVLDSVFTDLIVSLNEKEIQATVTGKETPNGRSGITSLITYDFKVNDRVYSRTFLFGLLPKRTKLTNADFDSLQEGSKLTVHYSGFNPRFNLPQNDPYKYDKILFVILGIVVLGIVATNEFKQIRKKRQSV